MIRRHARDRKDLRVEVSVPHDKAWGVDTELLQLGGGLDGIPCTAHDIVAKRLPVSVRRRPGGWPVRAIYRLLFGLSTGGRMRQPIVISGFILALVATAGGAQGSKVTGTSFEPRWTVVSPSGRAYDAEGVLFVLRSWVDRRSKAVSHQLYVQHRYRADWKFWQSANDEGAKALKFSSISRDVGSCARSTCEHTESFGVDVADSVIRLNPNGYSVKFYAKNGETMIVQINAAQMRAQFSAIDSLVKQ